MAAVDSGEQLIKSGEGDALQLWIWKAISGNWSTLTDWFSRWGTNLKGYFWKWSIKRMVIQSLGGYEGWVLSMGVGARGRRSLSPLASPAGRDNDPGQERSTPPSSCFSFFSTLWIKGTTWTRCRRSFYWFKGGITRHSPHFESASPPPIASWGKSTRGWNCICRVCAHQCASFMNLLHYPLDNVEIQILIQIQMQV